MMPAIFPPAVSPPTNAPEATAHRNIPSYWNVQEHLSCTYEHPPYWNIYLIGTPHGVSYHRSIRYKQGYPTVGTCMVYSWEYLLYTPVTWEQPWCTYGGTSFGLEHPIILEYIIHAVGTTPKNSYRYVIPFMIRQVFLDVPI